MTTAGSDRVDEASRLVAAAPRAVYRALVDQDALAAWLPPDGMTGSFERFDLRPGGGYRMVLAYDDPQADPGRRARGPTSSTSRSSTSSRAGASCSGSSSPRTTRRSPGP